MSDDIIISTAEENDQPIEVLDLSVRSYNCLKRSGIRTISQIFALSKNELLSVHNLGIVGYNEVREKLIQPGYIDSERPGGPFAEEL